jgi:Na+-translocating ferredoxin:NAD+ oxidoreductase RNF subunit RnfB
MFSLFGRLLRAPVKAAVQTVADESTPPVAAEAPPRIAIIQGRFCLAYTSFCTVCSERCPVPGAMQVERGVPMVVADTCTGCGICHDVCPAPTNAVLMLPRQRAPRFNPPSATP